MEETATPVQPAPGLDVVAAPQAKQPPPAEPAPESAREKPAQPVEGHRGKTPQPVQPKHQDKQPKSGVGMAIAATVLIVLGLGLMATFAYLQSQ